MSDAAAVLISLSALLTFSIAMVFISGIREVNKEIVSEIIEDRYRGLGFYTPEMTIEAGLNQPYEDCDYAGDETAYLKAGVYVKAYKFDELDPVFIRIMLLPSKLQAIADGCLNNIEGE